MESETPAAKAEKDSTAKGLNQSGAMAVASKAVPFATWLKAATANQPRTNNWKATSTYWTVLVVSMPRYEIQHARAMKTRVVAMLSGRLVVRSARSGLPKSCASMREKKST